MTKTFQIILYQMLPVTENASSKRLQNTMEINVEESLTKTEV